MAKRSLALLFMCLAALLAVPVLAQADTTDIIEPNTEPPTAADGFQALTCVENEPAPGEYCSPETPELFFTQAAGHPPVGFTQYIIQHVNGSGFITNEGTPIFEIPTSEIKEPRSDRNIKTLRVDLPPGLTVNPNATPKCSVEDFKAIGEIPGGGGAVGHVPACSPTSIVGQEEVTLVTTVGGVVPAGAPFPATAKLPKGTVVTPDPTKGTIVPVYNLQPKYGEPALFGFVVAAKEVVYLETDVSWQSDYHEGFTIRLPEEEPPFTTLKSRLVQKGRSGNGTFINNPTTCLDPNQYPHLYSTWFRAESYGEPDPNFPEGSTPVEAKVEDSSGKLIQQEGCGSVPFEPSIAMDAGTANVDSPSGATIDVKLPFDAAKEGGEGQSQSHVRKAEVTLPPYMGLNPAGAQGLTACSDGHFRKNERFYGNTCPDSSKIGTATVESPPLERPLTGDVYVGFQNSRVPESGEEFRILVEAKEEEEGINARLIGHVKADPNTGRLTAVFDEQQQLELTGSQADMPSGLPQVPFTSVKLHFDGSKAVLTSPPICSSDTASRLEPWARPGTDAEPKSTVTLTSDPGGGDCPKTMAERKFAPTYKANSDSTEAGKYSPLRVHIARKDGEQELKVVDVTLPKGLAGKLAGVAYCPESAIATAVANGGREEIGTPSCPDSSFLGTAETASGTGDNPLKLAGNVYLAGPYKGAPFSLVTTTPAVAGPFNLGVVVVRVALNVNPDTGQVNAVSDPIPDVYNGVKLDIRSIDLNIDRNRFMINPTNCNAQATTGAVEGGGADPTNPATFSSYAVNDPFQATACNKLGFKPHFKVQLYGPTKRAKNPRLKATLTSNQQQANVLRTALTMPHSLFLDQSHIGTVCTRPQLAAHNCPKASIYGKAWAESALLENKLAGKVYLVSSNHKLPDLLVDLRGQVEVYLRGVIGSKHGGLKTVFNNVPDLPVRKFVLNMRGGKKSLLVNSTNTCAKTQRAVLNIKGQNGKKLKNNKFKLHIASCGKHKKHKK